MKTTLSTGLNASLLQEQAAVITVSQTASVLRSSITNYIRKLIYVHFSNLTSHFDVLCSGFTQDDSVKAADKQAIPNNP